jgi:two-component system, chemotaxis family, CheB/CheR fusion protein
MDAARPKQTEVAANDDRVLERVLARIREVRHCDFRQYKRGTLRRRIERRMAERRCASMEAYRELLEAEPEEIDVLVSMMLIKVSSFFRDREPWDVLRTKVLPQIIAGKRPGEELRIWCAGCATGEEAYSVAILCAEVLGPAFATYPVKVFGTDVDQAAIATARRGIYSPQALETAGEDVKRRWFAHTAEGLAVKKDVRRILVFGVNDLVADAPISRLDLLICRNVFIYLDGALQKRVLTRFHYAMRPDGILMLGKSELIPFAARIFQPLDLPRRIYRKARRDELPGSAQERLVGLLEQENVSRNVTESEKELSLIGHFNRDVVNSLSVPVVGTALDGTVVMWNRAATRLWGKAEPDVVGKKLVGLGLPGLGGELLVDKAMLVRQGKSERETADGQIPKGPGFKNVAVAVEVSALRNAGDELYGLLYKIQDVTSFRSMELELRRANEDRQSAIEELQTTNEELQSANEELETTNEELQSANEELQTTNEELQSTNEELETTNEELQSTNAELDATNRELAHRTEELNLFGFYQRTIIRSLSAAVVVLDAHGRITIWNLAAERLLGLPENEAIGQLIWSLRIPALKRSQLLRLRRSLAQNLAVRIDNVSYDLPQGGRGYGTVAAIPISEGEQRLGSVVLFEDLTRQVALTREIRELRGLRGNGEPGSAGKPVSRRPGPGRPPAGRARRAR